ncbi:hypothetical protein GWI72_08850 [Microvirga tunisiensis]|uniref:FecR protein domain-containing protein n=2 Tax=Pannonibacter tanglangensis TaxID=2750084 RepID=A0A7X5F2A0_9HYPH|nr:hypothetical protein [Pannonibacter sp. XCT-53]
MWAQATPADPSEGVAPFRPDEGRPRGGHRVRSRGRALCLALCLALPLLTVPGIAQASDWIIQRTSGKVYLLAPGAAPVAARPGMPLPRGVTLATRGGAKAVLARAGETVLVAPNTTIAISSLKSTDRTTTLLQRDGTVTVDVQKRGQPHFTVETPYLAAVVKGTRFDVSVRRGAAEVRVDRGLVQVVDMDTGERSQVGPGQSASTTDGVGLSVAGSGSTPTVETGRAPASSLNPTVQGSSSAPAADTRASDTTSRPGSGTGTGSTPDNSGGNGNSGGSGNSGGNGNGNSGGNGNGNSGGNGNGNSGGNGNGNSGGNGSGNSGGNGNGNSGGNGNGNGNGNSGGNGNGNSGGNGNGNSGGNGNGNSGGNGNGNSGGNGNGNSGGNGNGNSGGNGNGNSGGNGNGNSGGNGNGNSGGNGNGNSGGNGNGNSGGNDNGNDRS